MIFAKRQKDEILEMKLKGFSSTYKVLSVASVKMTDKACYTIFFLFQKKCLEFALIESLQSDQIGKFSPLDDCFIWKVFSCYFSPR
jgi:hypothetical protein